MKNQNVNDLEKQIERIFDLSIEYYDSYSTLRNHFNVMTGIFFDSFGSAELKRSEYTERRNVIHRQLANSIMQSAIDHQSEISKIIAFYQPHRDYYLIIFAMNYTK